MKLFFVLILLLNSVLTLSQTCSNPGDNAILDSFYFRKVLNNQFQSLITGEAKNNIGSFAAVDIKESKLSFAGSYIGKARTVVNVKASGGITDGFFAIFDNSKLNTNIGLDIQLNILSLRKNFLGKRKVGITYQHDSLTEFHKKLNKICDSYTLDSIRIASLNDKNNRQTVLYYDSILVKDSARYKSQIDSVQHIIDSVQRTGNSPAIQLIQNKLFDNRDSIIYLKGITIFRLDSVRKIFNTPTSTRHLITLARNERNKQFYELTPFNTLEGFNFGWLSIGYNIKSNKFKLFRPTALYAEQVRDTSFVSHELRVQYSWYTWSPDPFKSYYWNVGLGFSYADNFSDLTGKEITEETNYDPILNRRKTAEKYTAYEGDYISKKASIRFYGDYYRFLFTSNIMAVHVYPEIKFLQKDKPKYNIGFGILYSLKKSSDDKSVVNTELYYNFLDLFNTGESTKKLFERNTIGIRFAFPITFKTNK